MKQHFNLTNADKLTLISIGVSLDEFEQIEKATNMCEVELTYKRKTCKRAITRKSSIASAIKCLGRNEVLYAMARAAFHWSSSRYSEDGLRYYYFDCSSFFRN